MKKILLLSLMFLMFAGVVSASSINGDYKGNPIVKLKSNGSLIDTGEVPAMIYDGKTMVPIAALRNLGADVTWDADTYSVDVKIGAKNSNTTKPTIDELSVKFGSSGYDYAYLVEYSNFNGLFKQIVFNLNSSAADKTKEKEYQEMLQAAVDIGADQLRINDPNFETYIFIKDLLDLRNGLITIEQYASKIEIQPVDKGVQTNNTTTQQPSTSSNQTISTLHLYSNDGKTYLGKLSTDEYDLDSIYNTYGTYGSKYASKSIFNEYGTYGGKYSDESAFNDYATKPPIIVDDNGSFVGYLTTNTTLNKHVSPVGLKETLKKLGN